MIRSSLCDYSEAYILVKGTITIAQATAAAPRNANKKVILKNCAPFSKCLSRINNKQVDYAHHIDIVMPIYNLIKYSDNNSKTSRFLWQYCRDQPASDDTITDFTEVNAITDLFKIKKKK